MDDQQHIVVQVKFFAAPPEAIGTNDIQQELLPGSTVTELIDALTDRYPALYPYTSSLRIAVNGEYAEEHIQLHHGDKIVCLTRPISGGC
jgi:molybdopterin converting factor small subunit